MADPTGRLQTGNAIKAIHYAYPALIFFYFLLASTISICKLHSKNQSSRTGNVRTGILSLTTLVIGSYVGDTIILLVRSLVEHGYFPDQDHIVCSNISAILAIFIAHVYLLSSVLAWGIILLSLIDAKQPVWYPYYGSWLIALATEISLFVLSDVVSTVPNNTVGFVQLGIQTVRICLLFFLLSAMAGIISASRREDGKSDEESQSLLQNAPGYGTVDDTESAEEPQEASYFDNRQESRTRKRIEKRLQESGSWWTYAKSFSIFIPHIWPSHDRKLFINIAVVAGCLMAQRGLNVLIPRQLGMITNTLGQFHMSEPAEPSKGPQPYIFDPWAQVAIYVVFRWLVSGSCLGAIIQYAWMPVEQYTYKSLTTSVHDHIMHLSMDFHADKSSGELGSAIHQVNSVQSFLDTTLFRVLPMLGDLVVAFGYFYYLFGPYLALDIGIVTVCYLWVTTKLSTSRNELRREYMRSARKENHVLYESLYGWLTVSYFNRIPDECAKFGAAVDGHQSAERKFLISSYFLSVAQTLVFTLGLLVACFIAVYQVTQNLAPIGSFVTLLTYWAQLESPITFFGNFFRVIQMQMIDCERLLEVFETDPSVKDKPDAGTFHIKGGEVEFENVEFGYDPRKTVIKDLSFRAEAGKTVAFVGETGGGKSTCLKLLFRLYDPSRGTIKIDGQNIQDVTLSSLREQIGIVPQDVRMFNDSIMSNLRYGRISATDEDVYEACRGAAIHDKIMSFPDGYDSRVGELGIKLSGGELQRVAIARVMIKNPKIILLDEATSSVDVDTEGKIQAALKEMTKGRTTIVVAHRLSTIMNADVIIVIKDGQIVEQGSHDELFHAKGNYWGLWAKQITVGPASASYDKKKSPPAIFNDLSLDPKTTDLIQAAQAYPHGHGDFNAKTSKQDKGKGKKLKPDAPEFIPRASQDDVGTLNSMKSKSSKPVDSKHDKDKHDKGSKKQQKSQPKGKELYGLPKEESDKGHKFLPGLFTSSSPKSKKAAEHHANESSVTEVSGPSTTTLKVTTEETADGGTIARTLVMTVPSDDEGFKSKSKGGRGRRVKAKSDVGSQVDGAYDAIGPMHPRRVSALNASTEGHFDGLSSPRNISRGRGHWRNRRRPKSSSGEGHSELAGSSSTDNSPPEPAPTPATPGNGQAVEPNGSYVVNLPSVVKSSDVSTTV